MNREARFKIGANFFVYTIKDSDVVCLDIAPDLIPDQPFAQDGFVSLCGFDPEEAYLLGKTLLAAARMNGVGD